MTQYCPEHTVACRPRDVLTRRAFLAHAGICAASMSAMVAKRASAGTHRPNILFAVADDASFPHMGAYGCSWVNTPGFDRVARNGILFRNAFTPNAKCAPSRACLLTGRNSWQLEEAANHWCYFPNKFKTYPEVLAEAGYHAGFTGKGWAPGIALDAAGTPRNMTGTPFQKHKMTAPTRCASSLDYAANFEDFLAKKPDDAPFCFWYGAFEPHRPYEYGTGVRLGGKDPNQIERVPGYWPDNETVRTDMLDYAYELEHFDRHLVRMLEILEARGELDNTIVVVTADNGMPFPCVKGQAYHASNHLPLAIMWPAGIDAPGRVTDTFVSFTDLAPTYLELAGVDWAASGMAPAEGRSLLQLLASSDHGSHRDHMLIGKERHDIGRPDDAGYPIRGIVDAEWLYVRNFEPARWPAGNPEIGYLNCDGSPTKTEILQMRRTDADTRYWQHSFGKRPAEELYHLRTDPDCLTNLAPLDHLAEVKKRLSDQMEKELRRQEDPRILGHGDTFDNYPYADKNFRDYHGRFTRGEKLPETGWVNKSDYEPVSFKEVSPPAQSE